MWLAGCTAAVQIKLTRACSTTKGRMTWLPIAIGRERAGRDRAGMIGEKREIADRDKLCIGFSGNFK